MRTCRCRLPRSQWPRHGLHRGRAGQHSSAPAARARHACSAPDHPPCPAVTRPAPSGTRQSCCSLRDTMCGRTDPAASAGPPRARSMIACPALYSRAACPHHHSSLVTQLSAGSRTPSYDDHCPPPRPGRGACGFATLQVFVCAAAASTPFQQGNKQWQRAR